MRAWLKKQERKFNTSPGVNSLSAMLAYYQRLLRLLYLVNTGDFKRRLSF